uniref:Uncharacterized protein n=1 Tax=Anopheles culicifacies TaxID=139723 RepID=A0A182MRT1_9DIPT
MVLPVVVVLLMCLGWTAGFNRTVECTVQAGIALKWIKPFSICGGVFGIAEGYNTSYDQHFPLSLEGNCLMACVSVTHSRVNFTFEWCAHKPVPALLQRLRTDLLDFTVNKVNETFTFYGCTSNYIIVIEIENNSSCITAVCRTMVLYAKDKNELPEPYSFHPKYTVGQPREKLLAYRISPILQRMYRKGQMIGMVEGLRTSKNFYPMSMHAHCLVASFQLNENDITFSIEQWNDFETSLMLVDHIKDLDLTVEQYGWGVKFYGCSANYRTIWVIYPGVTCGNSSVKVLMSYRRLRSELLKPFVFQDEDVHFKELGRTAPVATSVPQHVA